MDKEIKFRTYTEVICGGKNLEELPENFETFDNGKRDLTFLLRGRGTPPQVNDLYFKESKGYIKNYYVTEVDGNEEIGWTASLRFASSCNIKALKKLNI